MKENGKKEPVRYVVSRVQECSEEIYYCHMEGFPHIPVFGSIGTKQQAERFRKMYNETR